MIDFLKYRIHTLCFSIFIFVAFFGMAFYRYQERGSVFRFSVDFTGGTQVLFHFENPVDGSHIRKIVEDAGWHGASSRSFSAHDILVRVADFSSDPKGIAVRIQGAIQQALPEQKIEIRQTEHVGEGVGKNLWMHSLLAIAIALLAMLVYVALRFFSLAYATGAVVSLFHDAVVMLAVFLFIDREISINMIGAILTILGYSMNDTIVIFARIRDMRATSRGISLVQLVNESINRTLRRTLLTSFFTFLPVAAMLILGGEALRDFSLAILVGIVFGTYSSIYIASPIMMLIDPKSA